MFSASFPGFLRVRKLRKILGVFEVFLAIFEKTKEKEEFPRRQEHLEFTLCFFPERLQHFEVLKAILALRSKHLEHLGSLSPNTIVA